MGKSSRAYGSREVRHLSSCSTSVHSLPSPSRPLPDATTVAPCCSDQGSAP